MIKHINDILKEERRGGRECREGEKEREGQRT